MLIVSVMPIIIFAQRGLTQRPAPLWLPLLLLNYTTWPPEVKRIFQILFPWIGPVFASRVFAGLLASCWRPAGVLLASCWHPAGILLASCWHPAGVLLASCWRPAGVLLSIQAIRSPTTPATLRAILRAIWLILDRIRVIWFIVPPFWQCPHKSHK